MATMGERNWLGDRAGGARAAWADLCDSSAEMLDDEPCPKRMAWADLRDSSAEDLLDSQPCVPAALLHTESYLETPEPSFDHPQGSMHFRLLAATALDGAAMPAASQATPAWCPNAAACEFVPTLARSTSFSKIARNGSFADRFRQTRKRLRQDEPARSAASSSTAGADTCGHGVSTSQTGVANSTVPVVEAGDKLSEEDWHKRKEKRVNLVQSIRTTREYENMSSSRSTGTPAPSTPDPRDRQISKRKWEAEVMRWRNALREYTRD